MMAVLSTKAGPLPRGFSSPILAFELAATRDEVETMFAADGSDEREALRQAMDRGNQIDYLFMLLYGAFLATVSLGFARTHTTKLLPVVALAPLAAAADAVENIQLLTITRALGGDYTTALDRLQVWTRVKWGALALALVCLAPALFRGNLLERMVGTLCALTGLTALAAIYQRAYCMEVFALCVMLSFIGLLPVAWRRASI